MKKFGLSLIVLFVIGCHRSEFDVSPRQIAQRHSERKMAAGSLDLDHLPPGAVKHEKKYKKGDTLPDGTVADADRTLVKVEIPGHLNRDGTANFGPQGNGNKVVIMKDAKK